jgi:hypothetical protein
MPPQRQQGAGHAIGLGLVVVSPHVKQIHAVLRKRSSGPTISSGRPRRLINSRSFMSKMSSCPARQLQHPPGGFAAASGVGPNAVGFEGIGHDALSLARPTDPPHCGRLRLVCFFPAFPPPDRQSLTAPVRGQAWSANIVKPDPSKTGYGCDDRLRWRRSSEGGRADSLPPSPQDKAPDYPGLEICTDVSTPRNRRKNGCQACPERSSASDRNEGMQTRRQSDLQTSVAPPRLTEGARSRASSFHAAEFRTAGRGARESQTEGGAPGAHAMPWAPCSPRHRWKSAPAE